MAKPTFKSVDEYIASQPEAVRGVLGRLRSTIRKAVPEARELISYKMPRTRCTVAACFILPWEAALFDLCGD